MNIPKFIKTTMSKISSLVKDKDSLYFLTDTREIMLGDYKMVPIGLNPMYSITIYISPTGDDNNDGKEQTRPMKTINGALIKYGYYTDLALRLADGEYSDSSLIYINIPGKLTINSLSGDKTKVLIKHSMQITQGYFFMSNITVIKNSNVGFALNITNTQATISNCDIISDRVNSCITIYDKSVVYLSQVKINNAETAISVNRMSTVYSTNMVKSDPGQENDIIFNLYSCSTVYKYGTVATTKTGLLDKTDTDSVCIPSKERNQYALVDNLNPNNNIQIFISPDGNNNNTGFDRDVPLQTIKKAITKYGHYASLSLVLKNGIYNEDDLTIFANRLFIRSYSGTASYVTINSRNLQLIGNCISLSNLTISNIKETTYASSLVKINSPDAVISHCVINANNSDLKNGIQVNNSNATISYTEFNKCHIAVIATSNSTVYCTGSKSTEPNMIAFSAENGSTITKTGTVPSLLPNGIEDQILNKGIIR